MENLKKQFMWSNLPDLLMKSSPINKRFTLTPYEIINNRKSNVKFFHVFGSRCFIFNSKENRNKFDVKADEGIFLGYSLTSKAYRVLHKRSRKIEETYYVTFDDSYVKKLKASEETVGEIFSQTSQVTASIANLFEQFVELFDEPEKATLSEAKAADNKVDHLKQIVEDAAKRMGEGEHVPNEPPKHGASVEGENPPSSKQPSSQIEEENSILVSNGSSEIKWTRKAM